MTETIEITVPRGHSQDPRCPHCQAELGDHLYGKYPNSDPHALGGEHTCPECDGPIHVLVDRPSPTFAVEPVIGNGATWFRAILVLALVLLGACDQVQSDGADGTETGSGEDDVWMCEGPPRDPRAVAVCAHFTWAEWLEWLAWTDYDPAFGGDHHTRRQCDHVASYERELAGRELIGDICDVNAEDLAFDAAHIGGGMHAFALHEYDTYANGWTAVMPGSWWDEPMAQAEFFVNGSNLYCPKGVTCEGWAATRCMCMCEVDADCIGTAGGEMACLSGSCAYTDDL